MKILTILLFVILSSACSSGSSRFRDSPKEQAEDMEICRKANMKAFLNGVDEVKCSPNEEEYVNFK